MKGESRDLQTVSVLTSKHVFIGRIADADSLQPMARMDTLSGRRTRHLLPEPIMLFKLLRDNPTSIILAYLR